MSVDEQEAGAATEHLVRMLRVTTAEMTASERATLNALAHELRTPPLDPRRRRWRLAAASLGVAAVACAVGIWLAGVHSRPLTFTVTGGSPWMDQEVGLPAQRAATLRFSDGSEIVLEGGARAHVRSTTARGGDVVLESGLARVQLARRARAHWRVDAGPFHLVSADATCDLSWAPELETLRVDVMAGGITISGPIAVQGVELRAGHRLLARLPEGRVLVEALPPPESPPATGQAAR